MTTEMEEYKNQAEQEAYFYYKQKTGISLIKKIRWYICFSRAQ